MNEKNIRYKKTVSNQVGQPKDIHLKWKCVYVYMHEPVGMHKITC